jgi:hypothetical protein
MWVAGQQLLHPLAGVCALGTRVHRYSLKVHGAGMGGTGEPAVCWQRGVQVLRRCCARAGYALWELDVATKTRRLAFMPVLDLLNHSYLSNEASAPACRPTYAPVHLLLLSCLSNEGAIRFCLTPPTRHLTFCTTSAP